MIPFEEAFGISISAVVPLETERVNLSDSYSRILAEDIFSDIDMPPFNKSAVDGYACRLDDLGNELNILEIIPAGKSPQKVVSKGFCSKIMTGAPIPEGADCVVMVEYSEMTGADKVRFTVKETLPNYSRKGEDVKAGMKLISKGEIIKSGHVAVLASAGYPKPLVYCMPKICVMSTGDELVEPNIKPDYSQIRNSNAYQLIAQLSGMGCKADYLGIAGDSKEITLEYINNAKEKYDVILLTGGVSMGDFDHVPQMMIAAGFEILYKKIAIQPGRPTVLATNGSKLCFGLPGNPVSSFVLFELLVKPVIYAMMGHDFNPLTLKLIMGFDYKRKRTERMNVVPVKITGNNIIKQIDYHGSGHIHAVTLADGFVFAPVGVEVITKGTEVDVRQI